VLAEGLRAAGDTRADEFSMTTLANRYAAIYEDLAADRQRRRSEREGVASHRVSRLMRGLRRMMHAVQGG
jgi:hypothetical protein